MGGEKDVVFAAGNRKLDRHKLHQNPNRFWNRKEKKLWIVLIFMVGVMLYASRTAMPVCAVSVALEMNWTKTQIGMVLSSFFWGYITTQILGGHMADKYGGEYTIAFSLVGWSTLTFLTPFVVRSVAQSEALHYALIMRFLTGCFQGFFFPSLSSLFSQKVPESERAFSYSFAVSGSHIGTMFSGVVGSLLNEYVGWQYTFITIGVLSFALFLVFHCLIIGTSCYYKHQGINNNKNDNNDNNKKGNDSSSNTANNEYFENVKIDYYSDQDAIKHCYKHVDGYDNDADKINKNNIKIIVGDSDECEYEKHHRKQQHIYDYDNNTSPDNNNKNKLSAKKGGLAWCVLFTKTPFWALLIASFCSGWQFFIILSWLSTYFTENFPTSNSTVFNTIPWLFGPPSQWLSGWMADNLTRKGYSTTFVRKFIQSIAFLGSAFCLLMMSHSHTYLSALFFTTAAINFSCFHYSGISILTQDIAPDYAGVAYGIQNMAGSAPGFIGVYVTGYILEVSKNWSFVFDLTSAILIFGWVVFTLFGTGKRII